VGAPDFYKSQPLLSEEALLTAMAYVDLNPIRAKMAETPESSDHTSIKARLKPSFNLDKALINNPDFNGFYVSKFHIKELAKFEGNVRTEMQKGILFGWHDYLTLVDTTGRIQRADKRGAIPNNYLPILQRLAIEPQEWFDNTRNFEAIFYKKFYYQRECRTAA
jgi:hypothetical protein